MLGTLKPYVFHIALVVYTPALLYADGRIQTPTQQHILGVYTFAFLCLATRSSPRAERRQVWLMVALGVSGTSWGWCSCAAGDH